MPTRSIQFTGAAGQTLAGRLETPDGPPRATALFAHCFTCGKESSAAVRVSRALAREGIAVLRFDFAGIGASAGDFAATTFSSNVDDLVAAADHLRAQGQAPALLIGHSLGGAAVLAAASRIPEATAVATIAAPADVAHVEHNFADAVAAIEADGAAQVKLSGGKLFTVTRGLLEDARSQPQTERIARLHRALLVLHAPTDATVGIENATAIFVAAMHPKSFVSLDGADHFLTRPADAEYAARVISGWADRYLPPAPPAEALDAGVISVAETGAAPYQNRVRIGAHAFLAGEPPDVGGDGSGPSPRELMAASLGACTSMTLRMYAARKGWPVERIAVEVRPGVEGPASTFDVRIHIEGAVDEDQRARLLEIAGRCPMHRVLTEGARIQSQMV